MIRVLWGVSTTTVSVSSPNGPTPRWLLLGLGVTVTKLFSTVWVAEDRGVRRRTHRAKVTSAL